MLLKMFDKDEDGAISLDEFVALVADMEPLKSIDLNAIPRPTAELLQHFVRFHFSCGDTPKQMRVTSHTRPLYPRNDASRTWRCDGLSPACARPNDPDPYIGTRWTDPGQRRRDLEKMRAGEDGTAAAHAGGSGARRAWEGRRRRTRRSRPGS